MNRLHLKNSTRALRMRDAASVLIATFLFAAGGCGGDGAAGLAGSGNVQPPSAGGDQTGGGPSTGTGTGTGTSSGSTGSGAASDPGTPASPAGTSQTPPADPNATTPPNDGNVKSPPSGPQPTPILKSAKRGIAYDLADAADFSALAPGVSWWYNWSPQQSAATPADYRARYQMDFLPMVWNGNFNASDIESRLNANPQVKYLLVFNEPNLSDQANLTPQQAAALWPAIEAIAAHTGVKIVGPAITWGTMPGYADPVVWLDAFYAAYRSSNGGRDPQIDYLAFHWYDYGLAAQLDRLTKYGKPFWVTEMANWHAQNDGAQIDTAAKQAQQMKEMVAICESRADVFRYAWFTGRWTNDTHATSLLGAAGALTELGKLYLSLPF
jgi:hypothetical protein